MFVEESFILRYHPFDLAIAGLKLHQRASSCLLTCQGMFLSAGTLYAAVGTTGLGGVQDGDVLGSMRGATLGAAQRVRSRGYCIAMFLQQAVLLSPAPPPIPAASSSCTHPKLLYCRSWSLTFR